MKSQQCPCCRALQKKQKTWISSDPAADDGGGKSLREKFFWQPPLLHGDFQSNGEAA